MVSISIVWDSETCVMLGGWESQALSQLSALELQCLKCDGEEKGKGPSVCMKYIIHCIS